MQLKDAISCATWHCGRLILCTDLQPQCLGHTDCASCSAKAQHEDSVVSLWERDGIGVRNGFVFLPESLYKTVYMMLP